jgi:hypothetical protein
MPEIEVEPSLLDDVRKFIEEKWQHSECELCGTDRWMIYSEPNQYAYLIAAGETGIVQPYAHTTMGYLPLSCSNCGNLRLIDARIFDLWRKGRETKTKE